MRISLTSLFLLITSVAIMLWGLGKAAYYQRQMSQATFFVPQITSDEVAVTAITTDDCVVSVGGSSYARVSVIEKSSNGSTTLQQYMKQGNFTLNLIHSFSDSQDFELGFYLDGKKYVVSNLKLNQIRFKSERSGVLKNGQQLILLEASEFQLSKSKPSYSIVVEAVDIWKSKQKSEPAPKP